MSDLKIDELVSSNNRFKMKMGVFSTCDYTKPFSPAYYVAFLVSADDQFEPILENFLYPTGNKKVQAIKDGLTNLPWFPIGFSGSIQGAIDNLQIKLDGAEIPDSDIWHVCVDSVCDIITHRGPDALFGDAEEDFYKSIYQCNRDTGDLLFSRSWYNK